MVSGLVLAAALAAAEPESTSASDIVERAEALYLSAQYEAASKAFAEAYALDPDPIYLYARAQSERLAGDCATALELYDRYLALAPSTQAADEARINRARCEDKIETGPPPPAPEPGSHATDAPPARPWHRDPIAASLVGVGAVSTAIGAGLLGIAIGRDRDAPQASTEADFLEAKDGARTQQRAGIAMACVGGALVVGGIIRWAVVARRRPVSPSLSFRF